MIFILATSVIPEGSLISTVLILLSSSAWWCPTTIQFSNDHYWEPEISVVKMIIYIINFNEIDNLSTKGKAALIWFIRHRAHEFLAAGGKGIKIKILKNKNIHLLNERCFKCFEMDHKKIFFLSKKISLEFFFLTIFLFGGVKNNIKNIIALFCVSDGVEPGNDFFGFISYFF